MTKKPKGFIPEGEAGTKWVADMRQDYKERVERGEAPTVPEILLRKGVQIMEKTERRTGWLTDEQAYGATYSGGFLSDISTIPLKDIEVCPIEHFKDNYDWSNIPFEDIPLREYIEQYGETPKLSVGNNIYAYALKHEDIRKGWLNIYSKHNPWHRDQADITTNMQTIAEFLTRHGLYDKGIWLYPVLLIQVANTPLKGLTLKQIAVEDKKTKNKRHPLNIGSNYVFTLYNTETKQYAGKYRHPKLPQWIWDERDSKYIPHFLSREGLLRKARDNISRKEFDKYEVRRYRVLLGKPIYAKDKWSISQDRRRLTFKYNKGEIQPEYSRFLEHMVQKDELWVRTDKQWKEHGKFDEEGKDD